VIALEPTALLRAEGRWAPSCARLDAGRLVATVACCGALYGLVQGSLEARWLGGVYAALKLPVLLCATVAIGLPNLWIVHLLCGLQRDFTASLRGILAAQGTIALALAGFAPVTGFVYLCGPGYPLALAWNGAAFLLAALAGQHTLARHWAPLAAARPVHRRVRRAWLALYLFCAIKLGWVLRPFVGDPALATVFLREDSWRDDPFTNLLWTALGLGATVVRRIVD
jgi:hypothetical protein